MAARARNRLSAAFVSRAPAGMWCDGGGLWLRVRPDGGRQWVLRVTVHGRRREMGLGGGEVTLAKARELAARWRAEAAAGRDPVKLRAAEARAERRADLSLEALTAQCFEALRPSLKGDGEAGRWLSPLTVHVLPKLGRVPVTELDQRDIRDCLAPLWHAKAETARKALNRIGLVLKHAAAAGLEVDLQATAKARALLGTFRHEARHIPALPWREVPAFYATLAEPSPVNLALRLLILTGVRSAAVRHLHLDQIAGEVWTVPAEVVKGRKGRTAPFRAPLSAEARRVIDLARPFARGGALFPGARAGSVLSDMALSMAMRRRGLEARPHGFRSSLRDWLAEAAGAPHEVAEAMLGHVAHSPTVRAYRRTDFLDQRRVLMERWADHVTGGTGQLVRLAGAAP